MKAALLASAALCLSCGTSGGSRPEAMEAPVADATTAADGRAVDAAPVEADLPVPDARLADTAAPAADVRPSAPDSAAFPMARVLAAKIETYVPLPNFPEGPAWRDGQVFACAGRNTLGRIDAARRRYRFMDVSCNGTFALADGRLLIAGFGEGVYLLSKDNRLALLAAMPGGGYANDVTVDRNGNVYVTDYERGRVLRLTPAGSFTAVATGLRGPNGLDVDPESRLLYVCETNASQVVQLTLRADGGSLGAPTPVVRVERPDGMAFDAWGNLWVASLGSQEIVIHDPSSKKTLGRLPIGLPATNVTFGGPDHDTVFVTAGTGAGPFRLVRIEAGIPGFRTHAGAPQYAIQRAIDRPVLDRAY